MPVKPTPRADDDPVRVLLREAQQALRGGNAHQASAAARKLAKLRPDDHNVLNACAWIMHQAGDARAAMRLFEQSLAIDPDQVEALSNLASLQHVDGRHEAALALFDRALARESEGALSREVGEGALSRDAALASLHYNRGNVLKAVGRLDDAAAAFRAAIERQPDMPAFHGNLANTLVALERLDDAVEAYRRSLALRADHPETLRHLAAALRRLRRFEEAEAAVRQALAGDPDDAANHAALGAVLRDRGDFAGAIAAYRRAVALDPTAADPHSDLGLLLMRDSHLAEARACFERAQDCDPSNPNPPLNLGDVLMQQGRPDAAVAALERAVALAPDDAKTGSGLLFAAQYLADLAPAELTRRHVAWAARHMDGRMIGAAAFANPPEPQRRLRVGYVSPDFRRHAVSDFLMPLLAHHDRAQIEITGYAEVAHPDRRTAAFEALADRWRVIVGLSDAAVAAQIRDDAIDILVDLSGHTANHRLAVFALKPAPLQVTWLGYPATTGMAAIDYRLTDATADPAPAAEALHREQLLRLPHGFQVYAPREDAPDIVAPPVYDIGAVTFGSFNNLAKVNDGVMACWARLLAAVPGSRLLLKFHQLGDDATRAGYRARLLAAGIPEGRLTLEPGIPNWPRHMAAYGAVDIGLDPFPYNGTTTTCEALWMGVPVVTLLGDRHAGRVGASLLERVGLGDLIARDLDDYVAKAAALAGDPARLAALRAELRPRFVASPLGDAPGFARAVEAAYRDIWIAWCDRQRSPS